MKLRTLSLTVLSTVGLATLTSCKKDETPAAPMPGAATNPTIKATALPADEPLPQDEAPARSGGGSVHGTVTFKGTPPQAKPITPDSDPNCDGMDLEDQAVQVKDGKLANVLVRVRGELPGGPKPTANTSVVVDQNRCMYKPRVQGAVVGQPLVLMNSDSTLHNVRGMSGAKQLFNVTQPPLKTKEAMPPTDAEIVHLKCDIHPWMTAWVVVSPNAYFTTTQEDGAFSLEGVPPGTYTLEAWHESLGTQTAQVTVKEGEDTPASFEFAAATH
jgi:plastocyanin